MNYHDYIPDAIELVNSFDLDDEANWRQAVINEARKLASMDMEPWTDIPVFSPYLTLQF